MTEDKKRRAVVAALITRGEKFMITRRPDGKERAGLWEFVGGKAEEGESLQDALVRECREEIGVTVAVGEPYMTVEYDYPDINVRLTLFRATITEGEPLPMENNAIAWITADEIENYPFVPADKDILDRLRKENKL